MKRKTYEGRTPGPWFLSPQRKFVRYKNGEFGTANICEMGQGAPFDEDDANACLIADAPELLKQRDALLEVATQAYAALDNVYDVDQPVGERAREYPFSGVGEILRRLRAAIALVEGEPNGT